MGSLPLSLDFNAWVLETYFKGRLYNISDENLADGMLLYGSVLFALILKNTTEMRALLEGQAFLLL